MPFCQKLSHDTGPDEFQLLCFLQETTCYSFSCQQMLYSYIVSRLNNSIQHCSPLLNLESYTRFGTLSNDVGI